MFPDAKKCTHLAKGIDPVKLEKSLPAQGQELLHCQTCNEGPEIFICLSCGNRGCGRDRGRHALEHRNTPRADRHDVALSAVSWASWCYECDDWVTVESARLTKATNLVKNRVGPAAGSPRAVQAPTLPPALREKPPAPKEVEVVKEGSDRVLKSLPPVKGLVNLGNTCFFNSVIQVLSQTHWLTQLLDLECREGKVRSSTTTALSVGDHSFCLMFNLTCISLSWTQTVSMAFPKFFMKIVILPFNLYEKKQHTKRKFAS